MPSQPQHLIAHAHASQLDVACIRYDRGPRFILKDSNEINTAEVTSQQSDPLFLSRQANHYTTLIATCGGSDGMLRVWDSLYATVRASFGRGVAASLQPSMVSQSSLLCCDIYGSMVAGAGNDRTCRIWNILNERLVRSFVSNRVLDIHWFRSNVS
jgi:WD40 repeat protein